MKRVIQSIALMVFVTFATSFSCGQNGPTPPPPQPSVLVTFVPTSTPNVSAYCFYKSSGTTAPGKGGICPAFGTTVGTNVICTGTPATSCSYTDLSPITSATDTYWASSQVVVGGTTYESQPSSPSNAVTVPAAINLVPPTGLNGVAQAESITPTIRLTQHDTVALGDHVQGPLLQDGKAKPGNVVARVGWGKPIYVRIGAPTSIDWYYNPPK